MGFPRQEYWSGLPFPSPGHLPDPWIEPTSPAWQVDSLPLSHQGSQRRHILGVGFNPYPATVGCALGYVGNPHSLWVAPPTQWTWVWASSRRRWRTGKPSVVQSMESQRVRHDWATEQQHSLVFCLHEDCCFPCQPWDFPGGSDSKASAYNAGDWVQSLGQKDLLEKEIATHSSILAWTIPWTKEPGRLQSQT